MMTPFTFVLSLVLALPAAAPQPGWAETPAALQSRLGSIAGDITAEAFGDDGKPPRRAIPGGPEMMAAVLVALAYKESGWSADADKGPCYRGRSGLSARCDSGMSASLWQLRIGAGTTREGWTQTDLFADRRKAVSVAARMVAQSWGCVRQHGEDAALNAYASGSCTGGAYAGLARLKLARRLLAEHPRQVNP